MSAVIGTSVGSRVERRVHFVLHAPSAEAVFVAGSFNDWRPAVSPMTRAGDGAWERDMILLPGRYEYCFVVDNKWIPDPEASECVGGPTQSKNAVVTITAQIDAPAPPPSLLSSKQNKASPRQKTARADSGSVTMCSHSIEQRTEFN